MNTYYIKYLTSPLRFIFKFYFGCFFFLTLALLYPLFYLFLSSKKGHQAAFQLKRVWAFILQLGYFSFFVKEQKNELPNGPFIICSNHTSYLDIIVMYLAIPRYFIFMGKHELLKWPLFNIFFKKQDITVDRSSATASVRSLIKAKEVLREGHALALFPEGTIPKNAPQLSRFKDGAFHLAIDCQVPIVPVTFLSNWKLLFEPENPMGNARPGLIKVIVHDAIDTKGMTSEDLVALRKTVFNTIDSTLKERWK